MTLWQLDGWFCMRYEGQPWKTSVRVQCQSNSRRNWSQCRSKPPFESLLLPRQLKPEVSERFYHIKALAHKSKHCAPSKTNSAPVLPMRSILFGADCHPNKSRGGTTANSGQCIFKTEPENEINVSSSKALNRCNNRILLWGGFVYFFALK